MTQIAKIVDLTRSYAPVDPNSFPENLMYSEKEDSPEKTFPILAFEGYNFLPTSYGYRSYFGTNATLDIEALSPRCDEVLLYQFATYQNILVALCDDGIWTSRPSTSGNTWEHSVVLTPLDPGVYKQWTYFILANKLYIYRQAEDRIYYIESTGIQTSKIVAVTAASWAADVITFTSVGHGIPDGTHLTVSSSTPSAYDGDYVVTGVPTADTLTVAKTVDPGTWISGSIISVPGVVMEELIPVAIPADGGAPISLMTVDIMGIFRANGRIGMWNSSNGVFWGAFFDLADFTPQAETQAGLATFSGVTGRITTILPQGEGFVIYSTKSIVGVRYSSSQNVVWEATVISDTAGILYPFQVTRGLTELEHFVYSSTGMKRVGAFNAINRTHQYEEILTDIYDYLKESREPIKLSLINGRYLCFSMVSADYIDGKTIFTSITTDPLTVTILVNDAKWDGIEILPIKIGALTVEDSILAELSSGIYIGMYSHWRAHGKIMTPGVTPSAIDPYILDSSSNHIPNAVTLEATLPVYTDARDVTPFPAAASVSMDTIHLGWGTADLGVLDTYANEFIATQILEWGNFAVIQVLNQGRLSGTPPYVAPSVQLTTAYGSSADAEVARAAAQAAWVDTEEFIGSLYSGDGSSTSPVVIDVGTYHASCSFSRTFTGGFDVKKVTHRVYSTVQDFGGAKIDVAFVPSTNFVGPWCYTGANTIPALSASYYPYTGGTPAVDSLYEQLNALIGTSSIPSSVYSPCDPYPATFSDPFIERNTGQYTVRYATTDSSHYSVPVTAASQAISDDQVYPYFVTYVDTTSIVITSNPTISLPSVATLDQVSIDWGIGVDDSSEDYTFGAYYIPGASLPGTLLGPLEASITYPSTTFLVQDGSVAPVYPDFYGALILDLGLKKWGKLKATHKALIDLQPINAASAPVSYTNFGMDMGMLSSAGAIKLFDAKPLDSWIRYGKIGYYRLGMTNVYEIKVHFRTVSTGELDLDSSFDGRALEMTQHQTLLFTDKADTTMYANQAGKWHTIKISGQYDLQFMEFRGNIAGRR